MSIPTLPQSAGHHAVTALDDPRLAVYRNLKDAELQARRGRFIVEGRGNLRVLLTRSAFRPESILLGEAAYSALRSELETCARETPIFVAPQSLLEGIVGFKLHRGALAACVRPPVWDARALVRAVLAAEPAPAVLVLEAVRDADNVGGIFRCAMALGARAVFACDETCDPLYRKAIRTSMGGSLCVPFARVGALPDWLRALRGEGFRVIALDPGARETAIELLRARPLRPTALVLGTEGPGLSAEVLAAADAGLRIPMEPGVDSLNVATAAAIGLHELRSAADGGRGEASRERTIEGRGAGG
jgi:tRNA G18 (ribose-2'-O)-methylase SpoU